MIDLLDKLMTMVTGEQATIMVVVAMMLYSNHIQTKMMSSTIDRLADRFDDFLQRLEK